MIKGYFWATRYFTCQGTYMAIKYFFVPNISFFFNLKQGGEEL